MRSLYFMCKLTLPLVCSFHILQIFLLFGAAVGDPVDVVANEPTIVLGYWKIRGLGAQNRMVLNYLNIPFEEKTYEYDKKDQWFEGDKKDLMKTNAAINLPYLKGQSLPVESLSQSNAILRYLGETYELAGDTPKQRVNNDILLEQLLDIHNAFTHLVYPWFTPAEEYVEKSKAHLQEGNKLHLLEQWLENSGTDYLNGDKPFTADFHFWEILDVYNSLALFLNVQSPLERMPKSKEFYARMRANPKNSKYFKSEASSLPIGLPNVANFWGQRSTKSFLKTTQF